ncbi:MULTISPECIES: DUF427 domain-containing protein [unclassified Pseudonocardia]|uniref:DUF427 domain-containing protein n=1 Tax=unclassified Pseudonocardia TaxID=2619320 RepID=UPI0001FFE076|nr:DUF427 domain-containing protein [Pseudonocardia sp. Ae707_Ps1]OLM18534.1 protein of unknown function DUF427 [Pseudonocardia sp. Ae707_Ps1]
MGLTRTDGPLSSYAPATVNYAIDGPPHKLLMHPFPRRVRAEVAGRTVLDTRRGYLVHESNLLPVLYVPEDDVDTSVLVPSDHTTHCPFKGDATYRSLRVGDTVRENAVWTYPEPVAAAPWLHGLVALYWSAADAWYDEDEQVFAHLTDPYTRVDVRPTHRHVVVTHVAPDGLTTVLAESHAPFVLSETGLRNRWYLPAGDVTVELAPSETRTRCPYKGEAAYRDALLPPATTLADAFWVYPDPLPESARIAGLLSVTDGPRDDGSEIRVTVDGEPA